MVYKANTQKKKKAEVVLCSVTEEQRERCRGTRWSGLTVHTHSPLEKLDPVTGGVFTQGRLSERGASQWTRRDALEDIVYYTG
jgi:hypothetical protein